MSAPFQSIGSVAQPGQDAFSANAAKFREAAQGFEAVLVRQMLRELRQSSWSSNNSDVNAGYLQIADEQLANHLVKSGGFGFAKSMADQMVKQMETAKLIAAGQMTVK
jgi:flagellar protein FlgJ